MTKRSRGSIVSDRSEYDRIRLKNGWDLPEGSPAPLVGYKKQNVRAYELLVLKSDQEYREAAEESKRLREEKQRRRTLQAARTVIAEANRAMAGESEYVFDDIRVKGPSVKRPAPAAEPPAEPSEAVDGAETKPPAKARAGGSSDAGIRAKRSSGEERTMIHGLSAVSKTEWRQKKQKRRMLAALVLLLLLVCAGGRLLFGPPILMADISSYADVEIQVEGLTEEPFTITPGELAKMKLSSIHKDVHVGELAEGEIPERGEAIGPTLDTFLEKYGVTRDELRSMKVYSQNERSTAYVRTMKEETIVLSVANGRRPLVQKQAPLRIADTGSEPSEWSGWVRKIVFTME